MSRGACLLFSVAVLLIVRAPAFAVCTDMSAVANTRRDIEDQCHCGTAASHPTYTACARPVIQTAVAENRLPPSCISAVRRCVSRSTCGKPGTVTCLTTTRSGRQRCRIKNGGPNACLALSGACVGATPFCCDSPLGCQQETTTSTSSTSTSSTSPSTTGPSTTIPGSTSTTNSTVSTTTSTSTLPPAVCTDPAFSFPAMGRAPITVVAASPNCGGAALSPPATGPFSGELDDAGGTLLKNLGTGCLYFGSGDNFVIPGGRIPDGSTMILNVTGVNGTSATLGPSAGSGPKDCTLGTASTRHCITGTPGTDGHGSCTVDADCGAQAGGTTAAPGTCARDAQCFFGPPLPVAVPDFPFFSTCVVSVYDQGACGVTDLVAQSTTFSAGVSARAFITGNVAAPCPQCLGGTCSGGQNAGGACTAVGLAQTSVDCPPEADLYDGTLSVVLDNATTGTRTLDAVGGAFCAGQPDPGAFGIAAATRISTHGAPLAPTGLLTNTAVATIAAPFCIPPTGVAVLDATGGFPAPAAVSVSVRINLTDLLTLGLPPLLP